MKTTSLLSVISRPLAPRAFLLAASIWSLVLSFVPAGAQTDSTAVVAAPLPDSARVDVRVPTVAAPESTETVAALPVEAMPDSATAALWDPDVAAFAEGETESEPVRVSRPSLATLELLRNRLTRAKHIRLVAHGEAFDLRELHLTRDQVTFRPLYDEGGAAIQSLGWEEVEAIQVRGNHKVTGAKTGAILVGVGAGALLIGLANSAQWNFSWTTGYAPILIGGALALTLAAGLTGALFGAAVPKWETIYP